jgi:putative redox protein
MELLLVALGGCTGMDVVSILRKGHHDVTSLEVTVEADQSPSHPRRLTGVTVTFLIAGPGLEEGVVRRAVELSATKYCSVAATFGAPIPVTWRTSLRAP